MTSLPAHKNICLLFGKYTYSVPADTPISFTRLLNLSKRLWPILEQEQKVWFVSFTTRLLIDNEDIMETELQMFIAADHKGILDFQVEALHEIDHSRVVMMDIEPLPKEKPEEFKHQNSNFVLS